jgi:uncharacterized protein
MLHRRDYTGVMRFESDKEKNQLNVRKHGLDFANAPETFSHPMLTMLDDRFEYSKDRWIGIGMIQNRIIVVVYTEPADNTIRIISLRKALRHEHT